MSQSRYDTLQALQDQIPHCTRCPELREYCAQVGRVKRKAYQEWEYYAKPVPGFGDSKAWLWIVGLAPGAHGANRTGRMFTGDRSGDFLYAALHRAGLASQAASMNRDDGLTLHGVYISAALRCAPPGNKPTHQQLLRCRPYLLAERSLLRNVRVVLALGKIAWDAAVDLVGSKDATGRKSRSRFAHAAEVQFGRVTLLGSYHVSQQNTFTGRLTPAMLDSVLQRARKLAKT